MSTWSLGARLHVLENLEMENSNHTATQHECPKKTMAAERAYACQRGLSSADALSSVHERPRQGGKGLAMGRAHSLRQALMRTEQQTFICRLTRAKSKSHQSMPNRRREKP